LSSRSTLYGPQQSRFARFLVRREQRRPGLGARKLRRALLAGVASGFHSSSALTITSAPYGSRSRRPASERASSAEVTASIAYGCDDRNRGLGNPSYAAPAGPVACGRA